MYWQESEKTTQYTVPDDIVDVVFNIRCPSIPVDHSYALSQAVAKALPWFAAEESAGLHTIHVADSGNGWMRPDRADALLHLSHRTKLVLRLPKHRVEEARKLIGLTLDVSGNMMRIEKAVIKPLSPITTVFSRYVVIHGDVDENGFLQEVMARLTSMGIRPKKLLCGMERAIVVPDRIIRTRSLLLADLTVQESVLLQQQGLGLGRKLGCGLFIPHKDIKNIQPSLD
ncbi:MAG: type I-MYXAN CRISPR-associated protein Cas6/Cmx6 [Sulfuricaulis sp.]